VADLDDDRCALDLLIRGFQISRVIRLVADLGVADRIAPEGAFKVAELAAVSGVLPEPLLRAMRLLAAFGIFRLTADGTVAHTPRSLLLRTDVPGSLHDSARFWTGTGSWRAWEELDAALGGKVPHEVAWGMDRFTYLRNNPDEARIFDSFMARFPDNRHGAVAVAYDFSKARLIADIGGGNGEMLRRILAAFPEVKGLLFDRPDVIAAVSPEALSAGRITSQSGNFFEAVPVGADVYLLVRVLHDWSDEDAFRILRSCRLSMGLDARLLVIEGILEPDPSRALPSEYLIDMQMMAMFGNARERTGDEFRELLAKAGFDLARVIKTTSPVSILEAAPRLHDR
jgi:hypothetical protein